MPYWECSEPEPLALCNDRRMNAAPSAESSPVAGKPSGVLLLHGWTNVRPAGHWQRLVAEAATEHEIPVRYPQLPDTDNPVQSVWHGAALAQLAELPTGDRVLIGHSLACWTILGLAVEAAASGSAFPADRVLLVAPPAREVMRSIPEIVSFETTVADAELAAVLQTLQAAGTTFTLAISDGDPYFPDDAVAWGQSLGIDVELFPGHQHFRIDDGYGAWPYSIDFLFNRPRAEAQETV